MIPFFKAFIGKEEQKAVIDVLEGGWLTTGSKNKQFEEEFLNIFNFNEHFSTSINSNTSGLHIVLDSFKFPAGSEVIVPSLTFTACAATIVYSGLTPVIVDVNEDNLIDAEIIEKNITEKTVAVMVVHFAGKTADIDEINSLCKLKNIKVIEDCAHSLPSKYKDGLWVGSKGNPCIFSFYSNKTMTTGEGGMIISEDSELHKIYKQKRSHGMNKNVLDRFTSSSNKWEYDVDEIGYKYNLTDVASAIGLAQLKKLFEGQRLRAKIYSLYISEINKEQLWTTSSADDKGMHSHHLFQIRAFDIDNFRERLIKDFESKNIGYSVHYKPLHQLKIWKKFSSKNEDFVNSNKHFAGCISLPIYPEMPLEDLNSILDVINRNLSN
tara:strand:- start:4598 stop:5737 length:1140 start_codon:yes stop_codon:yes gene_type:complete